MSFSRDPLQEVKKIDMSVATRIERLYLDPAENMLLAAIILDSPVPDKERTVCLNALLKPSMRNQQKERLKGCYFLVHGIQLIEPDETITYHDSMKKLLRELPQSNIRDLVKDGERVRIAKLGISISGREHIWMSNGWKNTIQGMMKDREYQPRENIRTVRLGPPTDESRIMSLCKPANENKERDDEKHSLYGNTAGRTGALYGAIQCMKCGCHHAVGYCPITENGGQRNGLSASAIKALRAQLGIGPSRAL